MATPNEIPPEMPEDRADTCMFPGNEPPTTRRFPVEQFAAVLIRMDRRALGLIFNRYPRRLACSILAACKERIRRRSNLDTTAPIYCGTRRFRCGRYPLLNQKGLLLSSPDAWARCLEDGAVTRDWRIDRATPSERLLAI